MAQAYMSPNRRGEAGGQARHIWSSSRAAGRCFTAHLLFQGETIPHMADLLRGHIDFTSFAKKRQLRFEIAARASIVKRNAADIARAK